MSDSLTVRKDLIKEVINEYTTNDVLSLVEEKIKNGNFIEAYAITDQYIAEMVSRLLVVNKGELAKIRETINVIKTLDIMMRLRVVDGAYRDYIELVKSFKKTRNKLVHNSIYSKSLRINRTIKSLPRKIIMKIDLFYFDTAINLLRLDVDKLKKKGKVDVEEQIGAAHEKIRYFLEFLLNLYSVSLKKKKSINKKKSISDFSTFLARVISEIVPMDEKRSGVKTDYREFAAYLLKLIMRDLDDQSFQEGKVGI